MRRIRELRRTRSELDFSSSGRGRVPVEEVRADGELICNAANLVDWSATSVQLVVCEHCGFPDCASGNYVAIREAGGDFVLAPDFAEPGEGLSPPLFLREGGYLLSAESVGEAFPELLSAKGVRSLSGREAALLLQLETPDQALGVFPGPIRLDPNAHFVTAEGDSEEVLADLLKVLEEHTSSDVPVTMRDPAEGDESVSCFLDSRAWTEWDPLIRTPRGLRLLLAGRVVEPRT